MSAMWDNDEDTAQLIEEVLPDLVEASRNPRRWDHDALVQRARDKVRETYMNDTDGVEVDDIERFKSDSALAAEVFIQAMIGVAFYLSYQKDQL